METTPVAQLEVVGITKTFGGFVALDDVSLTVHQGEIVSLIGPNGAGKSTLFNQICGGTRPDGGRILFEGTRIDGKSVEAIAVNGIGRSFQRSNIFKQLSVFENVMAAALSINRFHAQLVKSVQSYDIISGQVLGYLSQVGLLESQGRIAGSLALGDQKRLEIAIVLAMQPRLMLLDEPTAGMSADETSSVVTLLEELNQSLGISLLLTEHDMSVVFAISRRIYVLNQGQMIFDGTSHDVKASDIVQSVYLGGV